MGLRRTCAPPLCAASRLLRRGSPQPSGRRRCRGACKPSSARSATRALAATPRAPSAPFVATAAARGGSAPTRRCSSSSLPCSPLSSRSLSLRTARRPRRRARLACDSWCSSRPPRSPPRSTRSRRQSSPPCRRSGRRSPPPTTPSRSRSPVPRSRPPSPGCAASLATWTAPLPSLSREAARRTRWCCCSAPPGLSSSHSPPRPPARPPPFAPCATFSSSRCARAVPPPSCRGCLSSSTRSSPASPPTTSPTHSPSLRTAPSARCRLWRQPSSVSGPRRRRRRSSPPPSTALPDLPCPTWPLRSARLKMPRRPSPTSASPSSSSFTARRSFAARRCRRPSSTRPSPSVRPPSGSRRAISSARRRRWRQGSPSRTSCGHASSPRRPALRARCSAASSSPSHRTPRTRWFLASPTLCALSSPAAAQRRATQSCAPPSPRSTPFSPPLRPPLRVQTTFTPRLSRRSTMHSPFERSRAILLSSLAPLRPRRRRRCGRKSFPPQSARRPIDALGTWTGL
mmetsp:Transcript_33755/g.111173  ORF Transcript_33755/g.111173 Transcript_33755/m.111173 type:complete len:514 (-) Transcript_33755:142-1683(-)